MRVEIARICSPSEIEQLTLTPSDRAYIEGLSSPKRRCEVASWRSLLRESIREGANEEANEEANEGAEREIRYSDVGAPYLEQSYIYIGVSHSSEFVAIITSEHTPCAIDIEDHRRDFQRVAHKYTTSDEIALFRGDELALALIWSAKETLYKISGLEGLDMIDDIKIEKVDSDTLQGRVLESTYELKYYTTNSHVVVHTTLSTRCDAPA